MKQSLRADLLQILPKNHSQFVGLGVSCGQLPASDIFQGFLNTTQHLYPAIVEVKCYPGYWLPKYQTTLQCGKLGRWEPAPTPCKPVYCSAPILPASLEVLEPTHNSSVNSSLNVRCKEGYETIIEKEEHGKLRCQQSGSNSEHGEWFGIQQIPVCNMIRCPMPNNPDNGTVVYSSLSFNSTAMYSCNGGYELVGVSSRNCLANKTWSGGKPECKGELKPRISIKTG